jgi:hypothetical protein
MFKSTPAEQAEQLVSNANLQEFLTFLKQVKRVCGRHDWQGLRLFQSGDDVCQGPVLLESDSVQEP